MITCEGVCPTQFSKKRTTARYLAGQEACLVQRQAEQVLCPSADHPRESLWMVLLQGVQQEQRQEVEPLVGKLALPPLFQPLVEMETAKMNVSSNAISPSFIQTNSLNIAGQHFSFISSKHQHYRSVSYCILLWTSHCMSSLNKFSWIVLKNVPWNNKYNERIQKCQGKIKTWKNALYSVVILLGALTEVNSLSQTSVSLRQ